MKRCWCLSSSTTQLDSWNSYLLPTALAPEAVGIEAGSLSLWDSEPISSGFRGGSTYPGSPEYLKLLRAAILPPPKPGTPKLAPSRPFSEQPIRA